MTTISLYMFETFKKQKEVEESLNKISNEKYWIIAKSKQSEINGIFNIQLPLTQELRKVLEPWEIEKLKINGIEKIVRSVEFIIDFEKKVIVMFRGRDIITEELKRVLENVLATKIKELYLSYKALKEILEKYSLELRQAYFKYVNGFLFESYKGRFLERNQHFKNLLKEREKYLRVITIVPKIFPIINKQVTINGDKGTLKFSNGSEISKIEVKRIIDLILKCI